MDPITFILWMYLSWGITRMFFRGDRNPAPEEPAPAEAGPRPTTADDEPADGRSLWERVRDSLDGKADDVRRDRDWADAGWWISALISAAWTPVRDVRQAKRKWAEGREERRRREEADDEPSAEEVRPEEEPGGRRWQDRREDPEDIEHDREAQPDGEEEPRRWWKGRDRRTAAGPEVTVEQVPKYGPRDPELERPIRALDPPATETVEAEVIRTTAAPREGIEPAMAGGSVAIPGTGSALDPAGSGGVAAVTGDGDSHATAKELARKILRAMTMTQDPVGTATQMIKVTLDACWAHVDRLKDAGIGGSVLDGWIEAVMAYEVVHQTAKALQAQLDTASEAAAAAKRRQASHGDRVQDAVTANPRSTANHTSYYGKQ